MGRCSGSVVDGAEVSSPCRLKMTDERSKCRDVSVVRFSKLLAGISDCLSSCELAGGEYNCLSEE